MNYLFKGDNFGFTLDELHLLGGNSGFRKISFAEISKINIYKGIMTKYPVQTAIFGYVLISIACIGINWFAFGYGDVLISKPFGGETARGFGGFILAVGVIAVIGKMALSLILIKRIILKVELGDGSMEIRSLKSLEKDNNLNQLIEFLMNIYSPQKLNIQSSILEYYAREKNGLK